MVEVIPLISEQLPSVSLEDFLVNLVLAVILVGVGIFLGKFAKFILKKISDKANLSKTIRPGFIDLFLTIIKWSIYILFLSLALTKLGIPQFTNWLSSTLVMVPALVGALILIVVGFAIAVYLKDLVEESKILGWEVLSMIFFYFTIYIFLIFALKSALYGQNNEFVNYIILILTIVSSSAVAYGYAKKAISS
ncbi:MAG: hypothetical protein PVG65_02500 [Candidatus Thorarchaeota archaeon]|jgi:hypothetical protein